jgi:hypothetical protein
LSGPQNQPFNYAVGCVTLRKTSCAYSFHEERAIRITVASFVDVIKRRPLSHPQPKVPDTCHNMRKSRDVSGKFRTIANERVPKMHCSTNQRTPLTLEWYRILYVWSYYVSFADPRAVYQLHMCFLLCSQSSLLISIFVFDFFQIPSGCSLICSEISTTVCTLLVTALSRVLSSPTGLFISYVRVKYFTSFTPRSNMATIWKSTILFQAATEMLHFTIV